MTKTNLNPITRNAIDRIATTRAVGTRAALFGYVIQQFPKTSPERDQAIKNFDAQIQTLTRTVAILKGSDPLNDTPQQIVDLIARMAVAHPDVLLSVEKLLAMCENLKDLAMRQASMQCALTSLMDHALGPLFVAVTDFCDRLWIALDHQRQEQIEAAETTGGAMLGTLGRMDKIGKHMRLVSLNASVEAARLGDDGRGLGVIATEFKTLAEEIQSLSDFARSNMASLVASR